MTDIFLQAQPVSKAVSTDASMLDQMCFLCLAGSPESCKMVTCVGRFSFRSRNKIAGREVRADCWWI